MNEEADYVVKELMKQAESTLRLAKLMAGSDESIQWKIDKYLNYYVNTQSVEEFWESSSAQC